MSQPFTFVETSITGLYRINRKQISDRRGFLSRLFCAEEFSKVDCLHMIAQINYTMTQQKGVVRGMHFQYPPHAETKIVTCIHGEIFDVAVDIRKNSSTFLHWHGEVLSADNQSSLYIPEGFAHGFQTLTDNCELIYLHSAPYKPDAESALHAQDPKLSIEWPLNITGMSERDRSHPMINKNTEGIEVL